MWGLIFWKRYFITFYYFLFLLLFWCRERFSRHFKEYKERFIYLFFCLSVQFVCISVVQLKQWRRIMEEIQVRVCEITKGSRGLFFSFSGFEWSSGLCGWLTGCLAPNATCVHSHVVSLWNEEYSDRMCTQIHTDRRVYKWLTTEAHFPFQQLPIKK